MKHLHTIFFTFLFIFSVFAAQAQESKNILKIAPLGVLTKVKLQYERAIGEKSAFLLTPSLQYGLFSGYKAEATYRRYYADKKLKGFYWNIKIGGISVNADMNYNFDSSGELDDDFWWMSSSSETVEKDYKTLSSLGGGAGIGWQYFAGKKKRLCFNFGADFQYYPLSTTSKAYLNASTFSDNWTNIWYFSGPGAVFSPYFLMGIAF
jgi:hypothetical protein